MFTKSVTESRSLRVVRKTKRFFAVQRLNDPCATRVVDVEVATCSCGFYKEHGVPCRHLCAPSLFEKENPQKYVIHERQLDALQATYSGVTVPVDVANLRNNGLKPPTMTRRRGRPKEKRYVSATEKKPKKTVTCGVCYKPGHNSRTCKEKNDCPLNRFELPK